MTGAERNPPDGWPPGGIGLGKHQRWTTNGWDGGNSWSGSTANGLKKLDVWLGDGRWDLIHFNFGIHDRATPPDDYRQRLETLVQRLKATGATLIWASTTPIPPDTKDGPAATEAIVARNRIAAEVMARHGVAVNDLFAFITPHLARTQNPQDVHFNAEGYEMLGRQVADAITRAMAKPSAMDRQ